MESKRITNRIQHSIFQLYYYLFYDYNTSKLKAFILVLLDIFQLFSININERVKNIFINLQNSYFWNDDSKIFRYFINFIINLNTNPYNSSHYKFYLVTLYATYVFVFVGIFLFLKLLRDAYNNKIIKKSKLQLSLLRRFLIFNIYIFYYPVLRKKQLYKFLQK